MFFQRLIQQRSLGRWLPLTPLGKISHLSLPRSRTLSIPNAEKQLAPKLLLSCGVSASSRDALLGTVRSLLLPPGAYSSTTTCCRKQNSLLSLREANLTALHVEGGGILAGNLDRFQSRQQLISSPDSTVTLGDFGCQRAVTSPRLLFNSCCLLWVAAPTSQLADGTSPTHYKAGN